MKVRWPLLVILLSWSIVDGVLAQQAATGAENSVSAQQQGEQAAEQSVEKSTEQKTDKEEDNKTGQQQKPDSRQGDFKPREEISEDYPVPLPADI